MKTIFNSTKSKVILLSVLFLIFLGFSFSSNVSQFSDGFNTFFGFQVAESYSGGGGDGGCCGGNGNGGEGNNTPTPTPPAHEHEDLIPSCVLTATPNTINAGGSSRLTWTSNNANVRNINQGVGNVTPTTPSFKDVTPAQTTTYTMTVTSIDNISRTCVATVTVVPVTPLPTCVISATPTTITAGQGTKLTWTSTNTLYASLDHGNGNIYPSDNRMVYPTVTTTYTMTVENTAGALATCATTVTVTNPTPAPTCDSFTATPSSLPYGGGTVTLNWNTTNATFVGISPTVGEVLADDSVNVNVTNDTTYTLEAANSSGSDYCQVTVDVATPSTPLPTCDSFTVYPTTLPANGGTVTLNWNTTNATFVGISPTVGEVLADDSVNVNLTSDTTYTLEAANSSGSDYCSVSVDVAAPPTPLPTCDSFTATPSSLPYGGGTVTLNWNTTNATFVGISPTVGEVLADDSVNVNVTNDTTYTLEAANSSGSDYCQVTVDVQPINPPVFSCSNNVNFSANPSSIYEGDNTTLTWNTTGVTSLSIDNGISLTSLNGSALLTPSSDITYTLTASNGINTVYCPVSIDVNSNSGGGGSSTLRCDLSVSDKSISAGDRVTIKWNTSNATDVILQDNFSKTLITTDGKSTNDKKDLYDDEITVQPNQTTSYILTATHGSKEKVCKVTVSVKDSIVVLQTRDQLPLVSGITLTQVPYTGFDAGPFLTFMFYALLVLWALYLAYVLVIRRNKIGGMSLVTASDTLVDNINEQASPDTFVGRTLNKPVFHQSFVATATASTATIGYDNMITNSDEATEIENRAHASHVLLSSDAMRYFVATTQGMDRMKVLDAVLERTKASYPSEDGWVVLSEERIQIQCDACQVDAATASNEAPFIPATLPIGNSSLAEVIVSGNIVAAYQMIGHRPMIALADAAADLDALYRIKQGGDAQVSDMLANAGENVIVEQLHDAIAALTSALDGTYTNEAEAVKMAIMKAVKAIHG